MKHRYLILVALLVLELTLVSVVFKGFYEARKGALGKSTVIPLNNKAFVQSTTENIKYYYEPKPYGTEPLDLLRKPDWLRQDPTYLINSEGFNNEREYSIEKPVGTFRIITLGDSFTFGQFVDTKLAYPALLENLLNSSVCEDQKYEVLNLGVPGYDVQYSPERFRLRGQKYNPDLVIWFLKDDDMAVMEEVIKGKAVAYKNSGIEDRLAWEKASLDYSLNYPESIKIPLQKKFIESLDKYYSGKLLIITFPFTEEKFKGIFKSFAQSHNQGYFFDNLTDIYAQNLAFPDKHPNVVGHQKIATDVFNFIKDKNIDSCR
ncbi:SGNH/GDSL hydrolase family protein [Candidatus Curtissbacteria bacterium]|nr:SGNH/GDSL hydrolase family protein [Candidatus Curtissbacteria bacterium]